MTDLIVNNPTGNFSYPPPIERYYTQYQSHFSVDQYGACHPNFYILQHSNNVCVVCLGSGHPLIREKDSLPVCRVDCQVSRRIDRAANIARGKSKQGAQRLYPSSILCYLCCENGEKFPVYSCIEGYLIEVNDNIVKEPQLLIRRPLDEGHIAVIMPIFRERSKACTNLTVMRERIKPFQPLEI
ncbi:Protein Simiate [Oopsacas minuta]|uniref:Protein Simiate n=1 Tax=Oopsacas minuta TaxID=111878 RepID=A0AAV7KIN9_9METZ|nr:Protein Simiate [Oopsacas minuta]